MAAAPTYTSEVAPERAARRSFLVLMAGAAAGVASRTVTAPIDRTRIICAANGVTVRTAVQMIHRQGITSAFRGNTINCIKICPELGLKFGIASLISQCVKSGSQRETTPGQKFMSGCIGGAIGQSVIYPLEVIRTQIATSVSSVSARTALRNVWYQRGIFGVYRGLGISLVGIMPYGGLEIMFAETAQSAVDKCKNEVVQERRQAARAAVGCISTATAASLVYPIALIRTRMQAQAASRDVPRSAFDVASRAWRQGGISALYRGLLPNLCKMIPAAAVQWIVFENLKARFGVQ
eukprot:jgi/Ulvmu1/3919/UM018_0142.1